MFQIRWLRRLIRRNMDPIPEETARHWKQKISVVYAVLAWNAFGILAYCCYKGKTDWANYYGLKTEEEVLMKGHEYYARTLGGAKNIKLMSIKGFSVTEYRDLDESAPEPEPQKPELPNLNAEERAQLRRQELSRIVLEKKQNNTLEYVE